MPVDGNYAVKGGPPVNTQAKVDVKALVGEHRRLIVEKGCTRYGTTPDIMRSSSKSEERMAKLAGIIAYLLRRDTGASDVQIAAYLGMSIMDQVILLRERIERAMVSPQPGMALVPDMVSDITDAVQDAIDEKDMVWHRGLEGAGPMAYAEQILKKALMTVKDQGVTPVRFFATERPLEVVRVRDVVIFLIKTQTDVSEDKICTLMRREHINFSTVMDRMKNPTPDRVKLLIAVGKRLGIPTAKLHLPTW